MYSRDFRLSLALAAAIVGALPAEGQICAAADDSPCDQISGSSFLVSATEPNITFNDVDTDVSNWALLVNDAGVSFFGIEEAFGVITIPFRLDGGAPANSLRIGGDGKIGLGTATPAQHLHVIGGNAGPRIRLERPDGGALFPLRQWDIIGGGNFGIRDIESGNVTDTFQIQFGAPGGSLGIDPSGDVGIGTFGPTASLHVKRSDGTAKLLVEEANASVGPREVFEIRNNGQTAFVFDDTNDPERWIFSTLGPDLIFDAQTMGGETFRLFNNGNLTILGEITTSGSCSGGCDYVFDPGYELESIDEHAAYMWEKSHLPGVGPTTEGEPVNLTEKVGGLINELEKAHIYIERLHERLRAEHSRNDKLEERLARLEAIWASTTGDD